MKGCWLALGLVAAGCAASRVEKIKADEAFGKPIAPGPAGPALEAGDTLNFNTTSSPERFARQFKRPLDCEQAARGVQRTAPEKAWAYLRACVNRGGFTQLNSILDNWAGDLKSRPDASVLLATIIAARGGHVKSDLQLVHSKRLPLFDLTSAVQQEAAHKGRYVVFVARVAAAKEHKGKVEVTLYDVQIGTQAVDKTIGAQVESTGLYGGNTRVHQETFQETFTESGLQIYGKLANPDPFLAVDKQFLFLAKFDGAKLGDVTADEESASEDPQKVALVSLVSYHDIGSQYTWGGAQ